MDEIVEMALDAESLGLPAEQIEQLSGHVFEHSSNDVPTVQFIYLDNLED